MWVERFRRTDRGPDLSSSHTHPFFRRSVDCRPPKPTDWNIKKSFSYWQGRHQPTAQPAYHFTLCNGLIHFIEEALRRSIDRRSVEALVCQSIGRPSFNLSFCTNIGLSVVLLISESVRMFDRSVKIPSIKEGGSKDGRKEESRKGGFVIPYNPLLIFICNF